VNPVDVTLIELGMERSVELLVRVAVSPPAGACADKYATQFAVCAGMIFAGVQLSEVIE
jgi:hypothetical protein